MFGSEYHELSQEEKAKISEEHAANKKEAAAFRRPSAKGRILDVQNTVELIKRLVWSSSSQSFIMLTGTIVDWWLAASCWL
jgi:hypothetical protein